MMLVGVSLGLCVACGETDSGSCTPDTSRPCPCEYCGSVSEEGGEQHCGEDGSWGSCECGFVRCAFSTCTSDEQCGNYICRPDGECAISCDDAALCSGTNVCDSDGNCVNGLQDEDEYIYVAIVSTTT